MDTSGRRSKVMTSSLLKRNWEENITNCFSEDFVGIMAATAHGPLLGRRMSPTAFLKILLDSDLRCVLIT